MRLSPVSFFNDNPEYKRHPNYTKTDQLPISEVITGLPRPYHHITEKEQEAKRRALDVQTAQLSFAEANAREHPGGRKRRSSNSKLL